MYQLKMLLLLTLTAQLIQPSVVEASRRDRSEPKLWSLEPVVRPDASGIDELVLARLHAADLNLSPEADRRTLIRRLTFDLTGLPPKHEDVERFLADESPDAYEQLVDRLLASSHFGERWARHWLDIASFGESHGFEYNQPRQNAWHYRNWVVKAFNEDLPYDRFARMQLAGDTMSETEPDGVVATGFLVAGPHNTTLPSSDPMRKTMRQDEMEGMVAAVGQTFLGLTLNCARCHDHKLDPVSQVDYYRIVASLADVTHGERKVLTAGQDVRKNIDKVKLELRVSRNRLRNLDAKVREAVLAERKNQPDKQPLPPQSYETWDFTKELLGKYGKLPVKLLNGARRDEKGLHFDGRRAVAETPPLPVAFREKTLEAWVQLSNLNQRGGGVMSLQALGGSRFDAIVFGEREPRKWMAGSESFKRYQSFQAPPETQAVQGPVHIAITYEADGVITGYRNGLPYGKAYKSNGPQAYAAGKSQVVFGIRHSPSGGNRMLTGVVSRARLYDRALSSSEVAASAGAKSDYVAVEEILERLDAVQKETRGALIVLVDKLQAELTQLEAQNRPVSVYALNSRRPPKVHLLNRGSVLEPAEEVSPGGVAAISGADFGLDSNSSGPERRKKLAAWITDPANPLFARVMVNRLWHHYFGVGIVDTPNDFGFSGGSPSHPRLLDWLADELRRGKWSLKAMHKTIVMSATYRQVSALNPEAVAIDAGNRLLWRKAPRRLTGEEIRDSMLFVSGRLDATLGGEGYRDVREYKFKGSHFYDPIPQTQPNQFRRTLYRFSPRGAKRTMLDTLDCPDPSAITPSRAVTTTPLQSLALMNNDLVLLLSDVFAARLANTANPIQRAYQLAFGRQPSAEEIELGKTFLREHGNAAYCRIIFNCNEFIHVR